MCALAGGFLLFQSTFVSLLVCIARLRVVVQAFDHEGRTGRQEDDPVLTAMCTADLAVPNDKPVLSDANGLR